ncbi:MAG: hypothetical protein ACP6IQ_01820 [Candidatus Njordarchaeia archaeon]
MNTTLKNFSREHNIIFFPDEGKLSVRVTEFENQEKEEIFSWGVEFETSEGEKILPQIQENEPREIGDVLLVWGKEFIFPLDEVCRGGVFIFRQKKSTKATRKANIRRFRIEALV